jgi:hypothetical protein
LTNPFPRPPPLNQKFLREGWSKDQPKTHQKMPGATAKTHEE